MSSQFPRWAMQRHGSPGVRADVSNSGGQGETAFASSNLLAVSLWSSSSAKPSQLLCGSPGTRLSIRLRSIIVLTLTIILLSLLRPLPVYPSPICVGQKPQVAGLGSLNRADWIGRKIFHASACWLAGVLAGSLACWRAGSFCVCVSAFRAGAGRTSPPGCYCYQRVRGRSE
jgi:hypothetical protein